MKQDFYTVARWSCIYLLLLEEENEEESYFFVGKTHSTLSKIYSKHINGGYTATKNTFNKAKKPKLYILKDCQMTDAEAYHFVIAYIRFFTNYAVGESLNHDGSITQSEHLKPDTEKIYQEISQEPLEDLLQRTYVVRAIDADRKRAAQMTQESKRVVQLNIAANEDDKAAFDIYCKQLGLSRRDAFAAILDAANDKTSSQLERIIGSKERKIEKQQQEISKLQQKLALATGEALPKRELWASAMIPFFSTGVKQYLQLLFPKRQAINPIKSRPYKGFTRSLLPEDEYVYPEEGYHVIKLQAVLWGNNRSCYYVGIAMDGKHYKVRYYAKEWFLGIVPRGSGYEEEHSLWLIGCKKATDGAIDLIAALPLPTAMQNNRIQEGGYDIQAPLPNKPSLADKLADIERRST